ncbi:MAG: hypothetical protein WCO06_00055 [Candidatus Roizmanbacteria bacterium]
MFGEAPEVIPHGFVLGYYDKTVKTWLRNPAYWTHIIEDKGRAEEWDAVRVETEIQNQYDVLKARALQKLEEQAQHSEGGETEFDFTVDDSALFLLRIS